MERPDELRAAARRGEWRGTTAGHCPAYQHANLVILPEEAAAEFAAFCTRNPIPCPLIEITPPGDPEPAGSAPGADLRTDLAGYRVYCSGGLADRRGGKYLVGFAATAKHCAFYPGAYPIAAHRSELRSYDTSKGTVRYPASTPLPDSLVRKLVRSPVAEISGKSQTRRG